MPHHQFSENSINLHSFTHFKHCNTYLNFQKAIISKKIPSKIHPKQKIMGKGASMAVTAGGWFAWLLDFCGWCIQLAGVAAMQKASDNATFSIAALDNLSNFSYFCSPVEFLKLISSFLVARLAIMHQSAAMSSSPTLGGLFSSISFSSSLWLSPSLAPFPPFALD